MVHSPQSIQLIVLDVDGVLTDGGIIMDEHGVESKRFHVRDGFAIRVATQMGLRIAALTGRTSRAVTLRLSELGVHPLLQGCRDKNVGLKTICERISVSTEHCAFIGDDLIDLPAMLCSGYPIAVANAVEEVKSEARFVTTASGGHGAVREAIEHVLKAQGRWDELVRRYRTEQL